VHGFVIREVDLQPVGNLFGRPTIDLLAVTAMWLVPTFERRLSRPINLTAIRAMNLALTSQKPTLANRWHAA
jgi:hypothetical protein